jgi:hypothetical protein
VEVHLATAPSRDPKQINEPTDLTLTQFSLIQDKMRNLYFLFFSGYPSGLQLNEEETLPLIISASGFLYSLIDETGRTQKK